MTEKESHDRAVFRLLDGSVRVWVEPEEAIYMMAVDPKYRAPVELTSKMAKQLAAALLEMADQMDD